MAYDCIPVKLSDWFYNYGKFLARHPLPFIIVPPLLTCLLMLGVLRINVETDVEYLYATVDAPAKEERAYFRDTFLSNEGMYYNADRHPYGNGNLFLLIEQKRNDRRVIENYEMDSDVLDAIIEVNERIFTKKAEYNGKDYSYTDVCSKWFGECVYDDFSLLQEMVDTGTRVTYPYHVTEDGTIHQLNTWFGDPRLDANRTVISANSFVFAYRVRHMTEYDDKRSSAWLNTMRDMLLDYSDNRIELYFITSLTVPQEIAGLVYTMLPLAAIMIAVTSLFSLVALMVWSRVRSKLWVGLSGLLSAFFGIVSALGVMMAVGVPFIAVVGAMPFLIFGIGLDDLFILVSAWRHTSVHLPTEERMALTLKHAAVSITITSVTDALAFGVGCLTPLRSVRFFCAYTGMAVVFVYIYIITFTCAFLVYSGRREQRGIAFYECSCCIGDVPHGDAAIDKQHSLTTSHRPNWGQNNHFQYPDQKQKATKKAPTNSIERYSRNDHNKHRLSDEKTYPDQSRNDLLTNHINAAAYGYTRHIQGSTSSGDNGLRLPWLTVFLGTTFADFLLKPLVKIIVMLVYLTGLAIAIYGCVNLQRGTDPRNLTPDNSYFREFYTRLRDDFEEISSPVIMVGFKDRLDYTDAATRDEIDRFMNKLQRSKYFFEEDYYVSSWLWQFEEFLQSTNVSINDLDMPEMIQILRTQFFAQARFEHFLIDVDINYDNTSIDNSRVLIKSKKIVGISEEVQLMNYVRDQARDDTLHIEVFAQMFIFGDQYNSVLSTTLINLGIAVGSILVVSLFFIPSLTTAVCITLATLSICVYVFGFMTHWDVSLDSVSMINLIQSIGFSVDFTAHISYHFVITQSSDNRESAREALGYLGTPIFQGALSTIISISILSTSISYIFRTFFKTVILVMVFGFFHAMFVLPVVLSSLRCDCACSDGDKHNNDCTKRRKRRTNRSNHTESRLYVHKGSEKEWLPEGALFSVENQLPFNRFSKGAHNGLRPKSYDPFYHSNEYIKDSYYGNTYPAQSKSDPYFDRYQTSGKRKDKPRGPTYFSPYDKPPSYDSYGDNKGYTDENPKRRYSTYDDRHNEVYRKSSREHKNVSRDQNTKSRDHNTKARDYNNMSHDDYSYTSRGLAKVADWLHSKNLSDDVTVRHNASRDTIGNERERDLKQGRRLSNKKLPRKSYHDVY